MAGTIVADTLTHSTAGSLTTDYVVNGSAKAWCNLKGDGTAAIRDSFNTSSISDNGTGDYRFTFSNAMNNANYSTDCSQSALGSDYRFIVLLKGSGSALTNYATTHFEVLANQVQNGYNATDMVYVGVGVNGDLA
jgi:hypothetical protein